MRCRGVQRNQLMGGIDSVALALSTKGLTEVQGCVTQSIIYIDNAPLRLALPLRAGKPSPGAPQARGARRGQGGD